MSLLWVAPSKVLRIGNSLSNWKKSVGRFVPTGRWCCFEMKISNAFWTYQVVKHTWKKLKRSLVVLQNRVKNGRVTKKCKLNTFLFNCHDRHIFILLKDVVKRGLFTGAAEIYLFIIFLQVCSSFQNIFLRFIALSKASSGKYFWCEYKLDFYQNVYFK